MRSTWRRAGCLLAGAVAMLLAGGPAGAQQVETSIDLNYSYEQQHDGSNVEANTAIQQKYQVTLETTLTSSFDFRGAISVDLEDKHDTDAATTSKISPKLELGVLGPQSAVRFVYSGVVDETDQYRETSDSKKYSNSAELDIELTPDIWPELKFKLQENRDYEESKTDTKGRTVELQLRDDFYNVSWNFALRYDKTIDELPGSGTTDATDWAWAATYEETLFGDVDFELAYEIKESYTEGKTNEVFSDPTEDYTQSVKTRLKKSLELSPLLTTSLTWEYTYDEDLLELEYDYRVQNRYTFDMRYDVLPSLKVGGEARRETSLDAATEGGEDGRTLLDSIKGVFDFEPVEWLRIGGAAEKQFEQTEDALTGGSVDHADEEKYELTAKNKFGTAWDLVASSSWTRSYLEGVLQDREAKFKADLRLALLDLDWADINLLPSYESTRQESWDELGDPTGETSTSDAKFKLEARATLREMLRLTFTHEYSQKITHETDEVANYDRELDYTENTRLNASVSDLLEGLDLEGEIERKADDTEGDAEPQLVEITYSLKLTWDYDELSLSSTFKYNDKGEDPDDLEFTAMLGWNGDRFDVSGDYQFTKTYSDLTDEGRKLNVKLSYKF